MQGEGEGNSLRKLVGGRVEGWNPAKRGLRQRGIGELGCSDKLFRFLEHVSINLGFSETVREEVVYIDNGILFCQEKEGNPLFATTWMDLDSIMLSEIS